MILPLLKGLKLTLKMFFSKPVTIEYPEKKRPISPRWRGIHYFEMDEKGKTTCVACGLCVGICPSHCISLRIREEDGGIRYPEHYEIDELRCIFCGYCQEACPVNAIKLGQNYEYVHYERKDFILDTEKLLSLHPNPGKRDK